MAACAKPTGPSEDPGLKYKSSMHKKFVTECLEAINRYRSKHQAGPLTYNEEIAKVSKAWAENLAKRKKLQLNPDPRYRGEKLGETLSSHWTFTTWPPNKGCHTVDMWYYDSKSYNFLTHTGPNTENFTQVVWKGTKEIGVGLAQAKDGTWFVVANYYPPGNVEGKFAQNVLPDVECTRL